MTTLDPAPAIYYELQQRQAARAALRDQRPQGVNRRDALPASGRASLGQRGTAQLRTALYMAAVRAIRGHAPVRAYYQK